VGNSTAGRDGGDRPFSIRVARPGDADALAALAAAFAAANPSGSGGAGDDLAEAARGAREVLAHAGVRVGVADWDGRVVGALAMCHVPSIVHGGRPSTFVDLVVVDEAHRRRGVATALVRFATEEAARAGAYKAALYFRPDNVAARRLYERCGLEPHGDAYAVYLD
jgi:ribosomal protein S18 acetylase RimI-like enzyme